jgi:hypothetical protein
MKIEYAIVRWGTLTNGEPGAVLECTVSGEVVNEANIAIRDIALAILATGDLPGEELPVDNFAPASPNTIYQNSLN